MDFISLSSNTEEPHIRSYLLMPGIVLFASVLTISNAQARDMYRVAPIEVVVYEGKPIDYSSQSDVIVIEENHSQNTYENVVVIETYTDDLSSPSNSTAVAKSTTPTTQQREALSNERLAQTKAQTAQRAKAQLNQPKAKPVVAQSRNLIAQNTLQYKQNQPSKNLAPKAESTDAELMAYYVKFFGKQNNKVSKQETSLTNLSVKQKPIKQVVYKKAKPQKTQLAKSAPKRRTSQLISKKLSVTKMINANVEGKDPELVAFYMGIFGAQKNTLSKKPSRSIQLAVKQTPSKIVKKKTKLKVNPKSNLKKIQLAKRTSKNKDPELVAFYEQVFGNDKLSSSKHVPVVVNSKAKDPELVAFYEREFGKIMNNTKVAMLNKKVSNKVKIVASSKSDKKLNLKKKVKGKTKNSMSTAAVELQNLIDELTSKNII